jgi:hypothetical protein
MTRESGIGSAAEGYVSLRENIENGSAAHSVLYRNGDKYKPK